MFALTFIVYLEIIFRILGRPGLIKNASKHFSSDSSQKNGLKEGLGPNFSTFCSEYHVENFGENSKFEGIHFVYRI